MKIGKTATQKYLSVECDANRIFGLDLLRAFAIFFVVHGHGAFLLSDTKLAPLTNNPFRYEVEIFFILTGFLIGSSFISYTDKFGAVDKHKTLNFYSKMSLRILPCYYFMLLINYLLVVNQSISGNVDTFPIWRFITMTQNIFTPFYDFYWESWCLPIQWWFYILFPFLLTFFSNKQSLRKIIPYICFFFILISIIYRIIVFDKATDNFWWDVWIRKVCLSRCDAIYVGVLAAWIKQYYSEFWNKSKNISLIIGIIIMSVVCAIGTKPNTIWSNVFALSFPPVAIALFLPFFTSIKQSKTVIGKVVTKTSVLSYAMYLTNLLICQIIATNFINEFSYLEVGGYLLYWVIVVIISYILFILIEKPFMRLRAKIS